MVGVSKMGGSCLTCRARKVKCDGKAPCGPCSIKSRICQPYRRGHIFFNPETAQTFGAGMSHREVSPKSKARTRGTYESLQQTEHVPSPTATLDANAVATQVESDQMLSAFIETYVLAGKHGRDLDELGSLTWIVRLPSLKGTNKTLDLALFALSLADIGRDRADKVLLRNAARLYGRALAKLQIDLQNPAQTQDLMTLVTCLVLVFFQIMGEHAEKTDWMSHVKGAGELVRIRGAAAFAPDLDNAVLRSCRLNMIAGAMCSLQPTFLSSRMWRNAPWIRSPKTLYDTLIDLMSFLPSLLTRCVELRDREDEHALTQGRFELVDSSWDLTHRFEDWYKLLPEDMKKVKIVDNASWPFLPTTSVATFPKSYTYSSLGAAHLHMLYWASRQVVHNITKLLYHALKGQETSYFWPDHPAAFRCPRCYNAFKLSFENAQNGCYCGFMASQPRLDVSHLPVFQEYHEAIHTATNICMSIPYCLQRNLKLMGPYFTLFPLKMAIGGFTSRLPETTLQLGWCYEVVDYLEMRGIRFSKKMLGLYEGRDFGGFAS